MARGYIVAQSLSHVQLFATPWTAACQPSLFFTISWSMLKLMSIELVIPSNHLVLCCPFRLLPSIFPSIRVFSNESALPIRWPKYQSFNFIISLSNDHSGLISFRIDWIDWESKGLSRVFSNTALQKHQFFSTQLSLWSSSHIHVWLLENPWLWLYGTCWQSNVSAFNTLSRFVIAFLPRTKHLLISWLQSPSAVILEPKKIKSVTVSTGYIRLKYM